MRLAPLPPPGPVTAYLVAALGPDGRVQLVQCMSEWPPTVIGRSPTWAQLGTATGRNYAEAKEAIEHNLRTSVFWPEWARRLYRR